MNGEPDGICAGNQGIFSQIEGGRVEGGVVGLGAQEQEANGARKCFGVGGGGERDGDLATFFGDGGGGAGDERGEVGGEGNEIAAMAIEPIGSELDRDGLAGFYSEFMSGDGGGDGRLGLLDEEAINGVGAALALHVADEDAVFAVGGGCPFEAEVVVADAVVVAEQFFFGRVFQAKQGVERRAQ